MNNVVELVNEALQALDPKDPMRSARLLVKACFVDDQNRRLLHHHRGSFWQFRENHYVAADNHTVRTATWEFLEAARQISKNGSAPFKPTSARVSNVLDALAAVTNLDSQIDPPAWLGDADELPPASEMLATATGLLHLPTDTL
jgi:putative DNA primase/helicase